MSSSALTMSYLHVPRKTPFTSNTIGQQLYHIAETYSEKEMYVFYGDNERIIFQQMKDSSQRFAASLLSRGMKKGDRIALWGFNHSEWLTAFYACTQLGILVVPLRSELPLHTVSFIFKELKCKVILLTRSPANLVERIFTLMPELHDNDDRRTDQQFSRLFPDLKFIIYGDGLSFEHVQNRSIYKLDTFLELADKSDIDKVTAACMSIDMDDPALTYFTSGSTGSPKAVVLSHHALLNNTATSGAYRAGMEGFQDNWDSVRFGITMTFSSSGSFIGTFLPLVRGCTSVILYPDFTVEAMAKALQDERVTEGAFCINHMAQLINIPDFNMYDFSNLRIVNSTGSVIPRKLRQRVEQIAKRNGTYGMTETLEVMLSHPLDPQDAKNEDCVYPVGGTEVKIVNDEGRVVPVNAQGELLVRSYSLLLYYLGEPEKTREFKDDNGWAHTGDVAVMDHRGFVKICGRIKDLITKNAVNLAPLELERILNQHQSIEDTMVVGVPGDIAGEEVCACIRLRNETTLTTEEVIEFCKGKVFTLLVPKYIVFVNEFPATEIGKFSRQKMSIRAMEMLGLKQETKE
ncbi:medium-chain acyl-CoA ligase ACSF2, mitochondrial-like [Amphiura filiformis]|uniref:medium-chain acyl-CoA ligase ACSF2, mitochondrial-like n=1 Tax=Amphiura filiformis TaxID=82378 RepID=UPI003B2119D4